ncbi:MAG TPA: YihY/virulence factor BrkB family protein [Thermoleophilaceae bacterium]
MRILRRKKKDATEPPPGSWRAVLKRTIREFREDNLTDWAAALTYYGVMSLFPMVLVLVAVLGLAGQYPQTSDALLRIINDIGPSSAVDTFRKPIQGVVQSKGGAGALLGVGLLISLWSASGYVGAFMRANNAIYEVEEGRPFWKLRPLQVAVTLFVVLLITVVAIGIVVTGPVARAVGDEVGLGNEAVTVFNIAKWPVIVLVLLTIIGLLYYAAPNVRYQRFPWITPGGVLALVVWALASFGLGFYAAKFGSYQKTYGTLAGVILFLVWLWVSNLALLLGAELNAELERGRELKAGLPAEEEIQLPPRAAASSS